MSGFLRRVNRTKVSPDLIGEVMEMHANLPAEDRTAFEVRAIRMAQLLTDKGFSGRQHADMALAIEFRITALARLLQSRDVRGWSLPGEEQGQEYLHVDLLRAAATEPVIESADGQACFDPEAFRTSVLAFADPKGNG